MPFIKKLKGYIQETTIQYIWVPKKAFNGPIKQSSVINERAQLDWRKWSTALNHRCLTECITLSSTQLSSQVEQPRVTICLFASEPYQEHQLSL